MPVQGTHKYECPGQDTNPGLLGLLPVASRRTDVMADSNQATPQNYNSYPRNASLFNTDL